MTNRLMWMRFTLLSEKKKQQETKHWSNFKTIVFTKDGDH